MFANLLSVMQSSPPGRTGEIIGEGQLRDGVKVHGMSGGPEHVAMPLPRWR